MRCETFGDDWLAMDLPFACEIHASEPRQGKDPASKRVLSIFSEPKLLMVRDEWVRAHHRQFDLIVTYDERLLDLPNARRLYFGGCWCDRPPSRKDFAVTFLLSTGCGHPHLDGYRLRKQVPALLDKGLLPARLFLSSRRLALSPDEHASLNTIIAGGRVPSFRIKEDKAPLFEGMFHIAVENARDESYFSEKLIDCFRTFTVPIYYGSRSVAGIFDESGIIFVDGIEALEAKLSSLSPQDYWDRLAVMHKNHAIAARFLDPVANLRQLLIEQFGGRPS